MIFAWPWQLSARGVVGINQRNADYILPFNERDHYPLVDDKFRTKTLALAHGIAAPELFGLIKSNHEVASLRERIGSRQSFVIKPAAGSGGQGILVFTAATKDRFRTIHGPMLSIEQLQHHVLNILTGMFSLGGQPDKAIIEYRVEPDPIFEHVTFRGVPDIRIILFKGVPAMAMLRLPTSSSEGKANLHQGAIGVGVSMHDGITSTAVSKGAIVSEHPDTGQSIIGLQLPHWNRLLEIAVQCADLAGLGYLGVDLVLDKNQGPLLLEMNARPGLAIQLANRAGLRSRLEKIAEAREGLTDAQSRIAFSQSSF
jgi:alpha-L-glutamate ligase-like protein